MFTYKIYLNGEFADSKPSKTQAKIAEINYKLCGYKVTIKKVISVPTFVNQIQVNGAVTLLLALLLSVCTFAQGFNPESGIGTSDVFVMNGKEYPVFAESPGSEDWYIKLYEKDGTVTALWLCNCEYEVMEAAEFKKLTGVTPNTPKAVFLTGNVQTYKCPVVTGLDRIKEVFPHLPQDKQIEILNISNGQPARMSQYRYAPDNYHN